jgi:hypothetical protein
MLFKITPNQWFRKLLGSRASTMVVNSEIYRKGIPVKNKRIPAVPAALQFMWPAAYRSEIHSIVAKKDVIL